MQFLAEYGLFLAKALTIVGSLLFTALGLVAIGLKQKKDSENHLEVTHLNEQYEEMEQTLAEALLSPERLKQKIKGDKKAKKAKAKVEKREAKKAEEGGGEHDKRIYVVDFDGDIRASAVASLRQEISAILTMADSRDEVLVRLESGGGVVHGYGLASSQLQRIRDREIPLTISVDKVAASGGYMMACVADTIIAAPFAVLGSIGVLAQIPNLHRFLKKHDIDFEQLHAGEYKRTLTVFGENSDKARAKMREELEETHELFKGYVKTQRPDLDIDRVATGEHWLGSRALELGLVDRLQTSDDYLMSSRRDAQLVLLKYAKKKTLMERLSSLMTLNRSTLEKASEDLGKPLLL